MPLMSQLVFFICSEWYEKPNNNDKPHFLNWYSKIVK